MLTTSPARIADDGPFCEGLRLYDLGVRVRDPRRLAVSLRLGPMEDDAGRGAVGSGLTLIGQQSQRGRTRWRRLE